MNKPFNKQKNNDRPQSPFSTGPRIYPAAEEYLERDVCMPHEIRDDTDCGEPDLEY